MDWGAALLHIGLWLLPTLWAGLWLLPFVWALVSHLQRRRQTSGGLSPTEYALAEERSAALLLDLLDEREYQQLMQRGYLDIVSPSSAERVYRIPRNAGRVLLFEHGRARVELCVQPTEPLPANDVIVMHKLMIEGNEQGYLARANHLPLALPQHIDQHAWWAVLRP